MSVHRSFPLESVESKDYPGTAEFCALFGGDLVFPGNYACTIGQRYCQISEIVAHSPIESHGAM